MTEQADTGQGVENMLRAVFDDLQQHDDPKVHEDRKDEFVFHMTDGLGDVRGLAAVLSDPKTADRQERARQLASFFYHALPHLNEAGRLLLDRLPDPFDSSGRSHCRAGNPLAPKTE